MDETPPSRPKGSVGGRYAENGDGEKEYYDRPLEFLSLGMMAYIGNDKVLNP